MALHAGVHSARLRLWTAGNGVRVEVADDGAGFDPQAVPPHRYGVRESIQARMAAVGGQAEIVSAPGQGTRVLLEWSDGD